MDNLIEVTVSQKIAELTLNKPKAFNSFDLEMISELAKKLIELSTDNGVKGIIITGKGKAFCAGGDLGWVSSYSDHYQTSFNTLAGQFHAAILEIRRMKKPVVAAINGMAAGGGFSLALACDFRVMEKSAIMKQAYTSNGLSIDGGGTFTLPKLVGMAKALEIAAFDEAISSEKALEWGMITKVAEDGSSLEESRAMMAKIMKKSVNSFGMVKNLVNDSYNRSLEATLEKERKGLGDCGIHPDGLEGINAFLEKRKPVFE
jgi:2-(1,2-epoxy-1,2-dihydrophenyl)acetyl-CoA isomerase